MIPEAQRVAIAEACGWTKVALESSGTGMYLFGYPRGVANDGEREIQCGHLVMIVGRKAKTVVPDYLSDLNAMHEAEKELMCRDSGYGNELERIVDRDAADRACAAIYHATAAQRAEAFLRTLGKWEDGK